MISIIFSTIGRKVHFFPSTEQASPFFDPQEKKTRMQYGKKTFILVV